jgi:hypothetical protein
MFGCSRDGYATLLTTQKGPRRASEVRMRLGHYRAVGSSELLGEIIVNLSQKPTASSEHPPDLKVAESQSPVPAEKDQHHWMTIPVE